VDEGRIDRRRDNDRRAGDVLREELPDERNRQERPLPIALVRVTNRAQTCDGLLIGVRLRREWSRGQIGRLPVQPCRGARDTLGPADLLLSEARSTDNGLCPRVWLWGDIDVVDVQRETEGNP